MTKELETKLVNALKKAGMSEGLAEAFKEQDDKTVETFITSLTPKTDITIEEIVGSSAFEKYVDEVGLDGILNKSKKTQSEFDKKVNKALGTYRKNLLGQEVEDDDSKLNKDQTGNDGNDSAVLKMLQALKDEVATLKNERVTTSKKETVQSLLAKTKLPENLQSKWISRVDITAENLDDQVKELETEYLEFATPKTDYKFDQQRRTDKTVSTSEAAKLKELSGKL